MLGEQSHPPAHKLGLSSRMPLSDSPPAVRPAVPFKDPPLERLDSILFLTEVGEAELIGRPGAPPVVGPDLFA